MRHGKGNTVLEIPIRVFRRVPKGGRLDAVVNRSLAIPALIALLEGPMGATQLNQAIGGFAGQSSILARVFADAGLVTIEERPGVAGRSAFTYSLTPLGEKLARALEKAADLLPDEEPRAPRRR